jgi:hypothetical protein
MSSTKKLYKKNDILMEMTDRQLDENGVMTTIERIIKKTDDLIFFKYFKNVDNKKKKITISKKPSEDTYSVKETTEDKTTELKLDNEKLIKYINADKDLDFIKVMNENKKMLKGGRKTSRKSSRKPSRKTSRKPSRKSSLAPKSRKSSRRVSKKPL